MSNNDILRRVRYIFDFDDPQMLALFDLAGHPVTSEQISSWLKRDDDPEHQACSDVHLATFLNGLIVDKRGKKDGPQPVPEQQLTNNIILKKIRIALNLQADEIIELMDAAGLHISKHELSALFRKLGNKHYRECKDQVLSAFLKGLRLKYRADR